ncbi:hypothetical protein [Streptomyces canus]|uniref:hypothetical protein n=1 Tax=Streptomyces canus TaxID=58343 RepID=UPI0037222D7C
MVECKRLSGIGQDAEQQRRPVTGPYGPPDDTVSGHHGALSAPYATARRPSRGVVLLGPRRAMRELSRPIRTGDAERQRRLIAGPHGPTDATVSGHHEAVRAPHTTADRTPPGS